MAQVINLGSTQRRASPISGLSEGLSTGLDALIDTKKLQQN